MSSMEQILSRVKISTVCQVLTGIEPRRGRISAPWRKTRDRNVSLNDEKGTWFDQVEGRGGGILDFIVRVRGGTRADALRWCGALAGIPLSDESLSPADRARWAEERRELEQHLPAARHWQRAAVVMIESDLVNLKSALFDPTAAEELKGAILDDGIFEAERAVRRLQRLDGVELVAEYRRVHHDEPALTAAMVKAAKVRERAECRALLLYLDLLEPKVAA